MKNIKLPSWWLVLLLTLILSCNLPNLAPKQQPTQRVLQPFLPPTTTPSSPLPTNPVQEHPPRSVEGQRPWVDTTSGIHVFNDQLATVMSAAQWEFAATHYAGTQKMPRPQADRLRALNPAFLILHYRLGMGLGYRAIENGCQPSGEWLAIVDGPNWVQEWPGDENVQESWFYHQPEESSTRILNCDWGWYLTDLGDPGWRETWQAAVLSQMQANDSDGIFMDSLSVPNYLGAERYVPSLPDVNQDFEYAWSQRITNWLSWLQTQPLGEYAIFPNVGSWITSRDITDYSPADGVMVEGFALEADQSPYPLEDWKLQMNRVLAWIALDKALIGQTYVYGDQERMFALGSYLLVKGSRTYLNIELDLMPEWYPEYDIPIGAPIEYAGTDVDKLYDAANGVYRRDFDNGFVLVNPSNPWDGSGQTATVDLGASYALAVTHGGGEISGDGKPGGSLEYQSVSSITLPPFSAVVLLNNP